MKNNTLKINISLLVISGILFLISLYISDYLMDVLWIFYFIPFFIFGGGFISLLAIVISKKDRKSSIVGISLLTIIIIALSLKSELFKSEKILEATLMDDLSAIRLILRENKQFEVNASTVFTEDTFTGKYELIDNKIIFLEKRYNNDFIPDTVQIVDDKIILRFDKKGNPITEFATFFQINKNKTHYNTVYSK
jgi:hypothetical protein